MVPALKKMDLLLTLKMKNSAVSAEDARSDISTLLSAMKHYEGEEVTIIKEALDTSVIVCSTCSEGKDIFRELGGLSFLFQLIIQTKSILLLETSVKTLAWFVDQNVHNKKAMSKKEVFELLRGILNSKETTSTLLKNTVIFASTILYQNNEAQTLIQQTDCLQDFISMYEHLFPVILLDRALSDTWDRMETKQPSIDMWLRVNSVLCFAVNNPLNEKNQILCSSLFPLALRILQCSSNCNVIIAVSSFLSAAIANNEHNQDLFAEYDGIVVLKHCLQKGISCLMQDVEQYKDVVSEGCIQAIMRIVEVMDNVISDHGQNSELMGKLGCISMLLKLLNFSVINNNWKVTIVLTLGHCIDSYEKNMIYLLEEERLQSMLTAMMLGGDEYLLPACKYLIDVCTSNGDTFSEESIIPKPNDKKPPSDTHTIEIIDLSSEQSPEKNCINVCHSPTNIVSGVNISHAREENKSNFSSSEQSIFCRDLGNAEAPGASVPHNNHTSIKCENRLCPGEDAHLLTEQSTVEMTEACDEDEDILLLDVQDKRTWLHCDYCSCKSPVISKYKCGCFVLQRNHFQNMPCANSHKSSSHLLGQGGTSNDSCAQQGCEKRCSQNALCENPRKLYRASPGDWSSKHGEENNKIAGSTVKKRLHLHSDVGSNSSSNINNRIRKDIPKFLSEISLSGKKMGKHQDKASLASPLKENKSMNIEGDLKPKPTTEVFIKPVGTLRAKHTQNVPQNNSHLLKNATGLDTPKPEVSIKTHSKATFQHSRKCGPLNKALVEFSPFRKLELHEIQTTNGRKVSKCVSQRSPGEISVSDVKLLKASRPVSVNQPNSKGYKQCASNVVWKAKSRSRQNNENVPTSNTVSKYFASNQQGRKQDETGTKDPCHASDVPLHSESNLLKKKCSCSVTSAIRNPTTGKRNESISMVLNRSPGAEDANEKDLSHDTDIEVLRVFGSVCSKHKISNSCEVLNVVTVDGALNS